MGKETTASEKERFAMSQLVIERNGSIADNALFSGSEYVSLIVRLQESLT